MSLISFSVLFLCGCVYQSPPEKSEEDLEREKLEKLKMEEEMEEEEREEGWYTNSIFHLSLELLTKFWKSSLIFAYQLLSSIVDFYMI